MIQQWYINFFGPGIGEFMIFMSGGVVLIVTVGVIMLGAMLVARLMP